jgi:hypothetical protein
MHQLPRFQNRNPAESARYYLSKMSLESDIVSNIGWKLHWSNLKRAQSLLATRISPEVVLATARAPFYDAA